MSSITDQLFSPAIAATLPPLYSQDGKGDAAMVPVKFFQPWGSWTWYAMEFDGDDIFFGLVDGFEEELGYFSLAEMRSVVGPFGLRIERDILWTPKSLAQCRRKPIMRVVREVYEVKQHEHTRHLPAKLIRRQLFDTFYAAMVALTAWSEGKATITTMQHDDYTWDTAEGVFRLYRWDVWGVKKS